VFECGCRQGMSNSLKLAVCNESKSSDAGPHNFKNIQKGTLACIVGVLCRDQFEGGFTIALVPRQPKSACGR
jgi:hypothetical protein